MTDEQLLSLPTGTFVIESRRQRQNIVRRRFQLLDEVNWLGERLMLSCPTLEYPDFPQGMNKIYHTAGIQDYVRYDLEVDDEG